MPWDVRRDGRCPATKPFAVVLSATGEIEGCHPTRPKANAQLAALYASEHKAFDESEHPRDFHGRFRRVGEVATAITDTMLKWRRLQIGSQRIDRDEPPSHEQIVKNWTSQVRGRLSKDREAIGRVADANRANRANAGYQRLIRGLPSDHVVVTHETHGPRATTLLASGEEAARRAAGTTVVRDDHVHAVVNDAGVEGTGKRPSDHPAATSGYGLAAVLRHEYGHSIDDSLPRDVRRHILDAIPNPSEDLTYYAGYRGDQEVIPELLATISEPGYRPEDFPPSVQEAGRRLQVALDEMRAQGKAFSPTEARDWHGRWTRGAGAVEHMLGPGGRVNTEGPREGRTEWSDAEAREVTQAYSDEFKRHPNLAGDFGLRGFGFTSGAVPVGVKPKDWLNWKADQVVNQSLGVTAYQGTGSVIQLNDGIPIPDDLTFTSSRDAYGIATHELGHAWFNQNGWNGAADAGGLLNHFGISPRDVAPLSEYATTDPREGLAEMYASKYGHGKKMSPELARKFDRLVKDLNEQGDHLHDNLEGMGELAGLIGPGSPLWPQAVAVSKANLAANDWVATNPLLDLLDKGQKAVSEAWVDEKRDPHGRWTANISGVEHLVHAGFAGGDWAAADRPLDVPAPPRAGAVNHMGLDEAEVHRRLVATYRRNPTAEEDGQWYERQRRVIGRLANRMGVPPQRLTAAVAVLSAHNTWDTRGGKYPNLSEALQAARYLHDYPDADPDRLAHTLEHPGMLRGNLAKALHALDPGSNLDEVLGGSKVRSFYNNLTWPGQTDSATIDTHMARAIAGDHSQDTGKDSAGVRVLAGNGSGYAWGADQIRRAAAEVGVPPDHFQAAVWAQWRREYRKGKALAVIDSEDTVTAADEQRARSNWESMSPELRAYIQGVARQADALIEQAMAESENGAKAYTERLHPRDRHGRWTSIGRTVRQAARVGGGTLEPGTGREVTSGIAVAFEGHSSITPDNEWFSSADHASSVLQRWLRENAELFDDPNVKVGVWHDTEHHEIVLDPSEVVSDRAQAIRLGQQRNQIAVYDIGAGEEIPTGGTGDRPAEKAHRGDHTAQARVEDDRRGAEEVRRRGSGQNAPAGEAEGLTVWRGRWGYKRVAHDVTGEIRDWHGRWARTSGVAPTVTHPALHFHGVTDTDKPGRNHLSRIQRAGFGRTPLMLMVTTAWPDMQTYASPALGRLLTPQYDYRMAETDASGVPWAADNGMYSAKDTSAFRKMVDKMVKLKVKNLLWVTAPDTPFDARDTRRKFETWQPYLAERHIPVALVAQEGLCEPDMLDWLDGQWGKLAGLFIGGRNAFKTGPCAARLAKMAHEHGVLVHVGRVSSMRRISTTRDVIGADSADGTGFSALKKVNLRPALDYIGSDPASWVPPEKPGDVPDRRPRAVSRRGRGTVPGSGTGGWQGARSVAAWRASAKHKAASSAAVDYSYLEDAVATAGLDPARMLTMLDEYGNGFRVGPATDTQLVAFGDALVSMDPAAEDWLPDGVLRGDTVEFAAVKVLPGQFEAKAFDPAKHPRGWHGRFARTSDRPRSGRELLRRIQHGTRNNATVTIGGMNIYRSDDKYVVDALPEPGVGRQGIQHNELTSQQLERFTKFLDGIKLDPKPLPAPTGDPIPSGELDAYLKAREGAPSFAQKQAAVRYTMSSDGMNGILRDPPMFLRRLSSDPVAEDDDHLQAAIDATPPLDRTATLFRGIHGDFVDQFHEGKVRLEPGFMSTSADAEWSTSHYAKGDKTLLLHITAPAGTKGFYMPTVPGTTAESEFVLGRGTVLRIDRIEGNDAYVTVVAQD